MILLGQHYENSIPDNRSEDVRPATAGNTPISVLHCARMLEGKTIGQKHRKHDACIDRQGQNFHHVQQLHSTNTSMLTNRQTYKYAQ